MLHYNQGRLPGQAPEVLIAPKYVGNIAFFKERDHMKKLIAGNWKMNGSLEQSKALVAEITEKLEDYPALKEICDFLICPPFPYLASVKDCGLLTGAQDCSVHQSGAYTGDISPEMIKDCGGTYVILGHSERREYHSESDHYIAQKAKAAHVAGLHTIICVGETETQRDHGEEKDVVAKQLEDSMPDCSNADNTVIAYEPVWAIGTGKTATPDDVESMHGFIREKVGPDMCILYGGSMKPENAAALLSTPNVDGGLIGGASLKAEQFIAIGLAAPQK